MKKNAKPERRAPMTRAEALATLAEIVRTPVGEIDGSSPLAQEVRRHEVQAGKGGKPVVAHVVVKMPNKLDALKIIGSWHGWEKGTEADRKQADAMSILTAWVRSRRRRRTPEAPVKRPPQTAEEPPPAQPEA